MSDTQLISKMLTKGATKEGFVKKHYGFISNTMDSNLVQLESNDMSLSSLLEADDSLASVEIDAGDGDGEQPLG